MAPEPHAPPDPDRPWSGREEDDRVEGGFPPWREVDEATPPEADTHADPGWETTLRDYANGGKASVKVLRPAVAEALAEVRRLREELEAYELVGTPGDDAYGEGEPDLCVHDSGPGCPAMPCPDPGVHAPLHEQVDAYQAEHEATLPTGYDRGWVDAMNAAGADRVWAPVPLAWRHVHPGDVVLGPADDDNPAGVPWTVLRNTEARQTFERDVELIGGETADRVSAQLDPDRSVDVLVPAVLRQSLIALRTGLDTKVEGRS